MTWIEFVISFIMYTIASAIGWYIAMRLIKNSEKDDKKTDNTAEEK